MGVLLEMATVTPPFPTGWENPAVQGDLAPGPKVVARHDNEVSVGEDREACKFMVAVLETPSRLAVTVAV